MYEDLSSKGSEVYISSSRGKKDRQSSLYLNQKELSVNEDQEKKQTTLSTSLPYPLQDYFPTLQATTKRQIMKSSPHPSKIYLIDNTPPQSKFTSPVHQKNTEQPIQLSNQSPHQCSIQTLVESDAF